MAIQNGGITFKHAKITSDGYLTEYKKEDIKPYLLSKHLIDPYVDKEIYVDISIKVSDELPTDDGEVE